jgi:hypothetical protein
MAPLSGPGSKTKKEKREKERIENFQDANKQRQTCKPEFADKYDATILARLVHCEPRR